MPTVSMLASVADLDASQAAGAISQLLPSGVILPFGGATAPTGWLLCNGASISRTTYANLFAAIGTAHGTVDGNSFNVPDLRGRFIRGVDAGATRDPDRASRTAANAGGNTGDAVGSIQANATKLPVTAFSGTVASSGGHAHPTTLDSTYFAGGRTVSNSAGGSDVLANTGAFGTVFSITASTGTHTHSATIGGGDNESRPINANVNYIIKV